MDKQHVEGWGVIHMYTREQAIEEARRCLNCRMCANCIYGRGQICYETAMRLLK
jgi:NADPH-dependent glutamate synthase beta subunit-like oxidoreductase